MEKRLQAYLLLFLSAIMWGSSYPIIKLGLNKGLSPVGFLGFRLFLATLIIIPFVHKKINIRELKSKKMLILGFTNAGGFLFQYFGQKFISSNMAAIISNLLIIFVAILSFLILKEKINLKKGLGILISFIGLGIVSNLSFTNLSSNAGVFIMLISPIMWAFFVIYSKDIASEDSFIEYLFPIYFYTFLFILPFAFISGFNITILSTSISLYLAIFCTVVPYFLFLKGLKYIQATTASIITSFQILFSVFFAYFFLGETLTIRFLLGMILVFLSIFLVESER